MRYELLAISSLVLLPVACAASSRNTQQEYHDVTPAPVAIVQPAQPVVAPPPAETLPLKGEFECMNAFIPASEGKLLAKKAKSLGFDGFVFVQATVPDARINVEGMTGTGSVFFGPSKTRYAMVRASAPGYRDFEGYVEVFEKQVRKVKLHMDVAGGTLTVLVEPWGSKVRIDGKLAGATPLTVKNVKAGIRDVMVEAEGCRLVPLDIPLDGSVVMGQEYCPRVRAYVAPVVVAPPPPPPPPPVAPVVVEPVRAPVVEQAPPPPPVVIAPAPVVQEPAPAPVAEPPAVIEPAPAPAPVAPAPAPVAAAQSGPKPNCQKVCEKFVQAVSIESARPPMFSACFNRCDSGDMGYSKCAWMAATMADVVNCNKMPAAK